MLARAAKELGPHYASTMTEYAKLLAINDPRNETHARLKGTPMNRTQCGLETAGLMSDGEVTCGTCKRALRE